MTRARKWLAVLLAAVLILGVLPMAALAEEDIWADTTEVEDFAEFKAALEDETVERIKITGEVTVTEGSIEAPLETDKPILVAASGTLRIAGGAVLSHDADMGLLDYEYTGDPDVSEWDRIAEGMAAFLVWEDGDSVHRLLCGSQADGLNALNESGHGELTEAVFRDDVELDEDVESWLFFVMRGGLTIRGGLALEGRLFVAGDLTVEESGTLELGEYGGWVEGDVTLLNGKPVPEGLDCGGEKNYPHLAVKWNEYDYADAVSMTPYDEYELLFILREYVGGRWVDTEVSPEFPAPLTYGIDESHGENLTLKANGAEWGRTYEGVYQGYSLPVRIELPELGCYSAPAAVTANYLSGSRKFSPLSSNNEFYVCVNPDAWFVEEGWTVSNLSVRGIRYDENGEHELANPPIASEKVQDGVWKITASGCDFDMEFTVEVSNPENGDSFETGTGLYIEPAEALAYSDAPLDGESNDWGTLWNDSYRSVLHDTLSLKAKASKNLRLYLLVYQGDAEDGKPAGWYCEDVNIHQIRAEGVDIAQGREDDAYAIRVTAQSAGTHKVIRMQEEQDGDEWVHIPGSTRGLPLTVTVTASGSSGSSGGGSGSGTVAANSGTSAGNSTGDSTYTVSVSSGVTGGTVSVQPQSAKRGDTVTVTVRPEDGFEVRSVRAATAAGREIDVTEAGDGRYTFVMPGAQVTVRASFTRVQEAASSTAGSFTDVSSGAYYAEAVRWAVANGVTGGMGGGLFSPDAPCTRAQTVTFLWRAAGSPAPSSRENPFKDVDPSAYYYDAVLWAVEKGITGGITAEAFHPEGTVTRGQTAAFLYRAAGSPAASGSSFTDVPSGAYYAEAVQWAAERGITGGTGGGQFNPGAPCTRAHIVTFLFRNQNS